MTISAMGAEAIAQAIACGDDEYLASVGHAQTSIDIEILDEEGLPCEAGVVGEVAVRGPTVMQGYWKNPGATAKTLISGALHTGDVGMLDARGLLHLKDRSKDVIISGGTNIYPREVEEALLHHPAVREVSVIGTPYPEWGEAVAAVVATDLAIATEELNAVCLERIARFKRPKHYVFVASLPKNATGKVVKTELLALCARQV